MPCHTMISTLSRHPPEEEEKKLPCEVAAFLEQRDEEALASSSLEDPEVAEGPYAGA
jgi:hypothetical protein